MSVGEYDDTARESVRRLVVSPAFLSVMLITSMLPLSVAISPALPGMADSLSVSDAQIGLVITAITLPPMLVSPVVGIAGDIIGRRRIAIPGLLLFGVGGIGVAFTDRLATVLVLRGIQGIAMAGIAPLTVTLLGDMYTGTQRTTAQGMRSSVGGFVVAVGPLVAGALAGLAWQYPFYLYALSLLVIVPVYLYVPETAPESDTTGSMRESLGEYKQSIADEIGDISMLIIMLGGFVRFFSLFGFVTFIPIFAIRVLGTTPFLAGVVVAMSGVRILLSPTAGWWVSRLSRRRTLLVTLGLQAVCFALIPFVPGVRSLAALALLFGIGDSLFDPLINDATTSMVADENRNGVVGGLRVLKEAGKTAAPAALGGVLAVAGHGMVFGSILAVVVGYGVCIFVFVGHRW
jgi:MFS family permease